MRLLQVAALSCVVLTGALGLARTEDYPNRPVTLIVPFPPGGSTTVMARNVADKMSAALGQQIVVDNRGGAGGALGTRFVAKAAPDGYTILLSYTATMAIAPAMNANAGYDPGKDLAPIGMIGFAPSVLVVHPSVPVHSIAELVSHAKAMSSPMQYGSPGVGTVNQLAFEYLATETGIKLQHVPYKQGQRPGHQRPARWTYTDDVPADPRCARQHQGGDPACARYYQRPANEPAAGASDRR